MFTTKTVNSSKSKNVVRFHVSCAHKLGFLKPGHIHIRKVCRLYSDRASGFSKRASTYIAVKQSENGKQPCCFKVEHVQCNVPGV